MSDFIDDLNRRIVEAMKKLGICGKIAEMATAEMVMDLRRDWAGERPFIGARNADGRKTERNITIIRAWRNGESMGSIARREKLSRERVRQIIAG